MPCKTLGSPCTWARPCTQLATYDGMVMHGDHGPAQHDTMTAHSAYQQDSGQPLRPAPAAARIRLLAWPVVTQAVQQGGQNDPEAGLRSQCLLLGAHWQPASNILASSISSNVAETSSLFISQAASRECLNLMKYMQGGLEARTTRQGLLSNMTAVSLHNST